MLSSHRETFGRLRWQALIGPTAKIVQIGLTDHSPWAHKIGCRRLAKTPMTDAELLQHYIQGKRIIHGAQRSAGHHRLLKLGFIKECPVSSKNS